MIGKHLRRLLGNIRQPSNIFGHLREFSENDRKCSYELWTQFGEFSKSSEIFGKCSEIFGKLVKYPWCCCLYNKQNITCPLVGTNFIFSCSTRYLTSELRSLVRYRVEHSKIKFVSTRGHVISSISLTVTHDIFTCEEKFDIFTCKDNNAIVCALKFSKFNYWTNLNSFLCDRNICEDCSEIFGSLR